MSDYNDKLKRKNASTLRKLGIRALHKKFNEYIEVYKSIDDIVIKESLSEDDEAQLRFSLLDDIINFFQAEINVKDFYIRPELTTASNIYKEIVQNKMKKQ